MNSSADELALRLESALGPGAVERNPQLLAAHAVDGLRPILLCLPASPEQVAATLNVCSEAEAVVIPRGGGTAMSLGNRPQSAGIVIGMERLAGFIEHDPANLTATVQSGIKLAALQQLLARQNQFFAVDAPQPNEATAGGTVAANLNGPRRSFYGGVRDLVIGMRMVLITGEQIKAGGKVVKNVAGYDMCKLFVGSLGTLGIITEVTLRLSPLPETAATLMARGTLPQALLLADELSNSLLLPTSVSILDRVAAPANRTTSEFSAVAVRFEGFEDSVVRHLRDCLVMAERIGLRSEELRNDAHNRLWDEIRDFPVLNDRIVYRTVVPLSLLAKVMKTIAEWRSDDFPVSMIGDAGTGTLWLSVEASDTGANLFTRLTAVTQEYGGHAIIFAAPPAVKENRDVWGPTPPSLAIMREIKRQFDPKGLLSPGRFVGGI